MNVEEFREYCLRFDGVTERTPFGKFAPRYDSILVFYVLEHMFCFIDIDDFSYVDLKANPDVIKEFRDRYSSIGDPINQSPKHWMKIDLNGDVPMSEILRLVKDAYVMVREKYTKRIR